MSDQGHKPKETAKAAQAFADYVSLGPKRSLRALAAEYVTQGRYKTNTTAFNILKDWSTEHNWQARLKSLADEQIAEATELRRATYLSILRDYHRRYGNEAMVQAAKTDELHGVYDRVKPAEAIEFTGTLTARVELIGVNVEDI